MGTVCFEARGAGKRAVINHDRMSGLEQIGGNGPSHLANSDHPDLHVLLSPKGRLNIIKRP
jgi:hypothetical protein